MSDTTQTTTGPETQRAPADWDEVLSSAKASYVDHLHYPHWQFGWCGACGEGWSLNGGIHCSECGCAHTRVLPSASNPDPDARLASARPEVRARLRSRRIRRLAEAILDGRSPDETRSEFVATNINMTTTNTDDRSTWLTTGPLTAEQREATLGSLRDGDITASEAASLLGCTESEARSAALSREPDRYTVSRRVPGGWIAVRIGVSEYDAACVVGITRWTGAGIYRMTGTGTVYWVQDQREPRTVAPEVRS